MKRGISLIVLVITIIVMIILVSSVIVSLNNTGIINKSNDAVSKSNLNEVRHQATLIWSEEYLNGKRGDELKTAVLDKLKDYQNKYNIEVTDKGVDVNFKNEELFLTWNSDEVIENTTSEGGECVKVADFIPNIEEFERYFLSFTNIIANGEVVSNGYCGEFYRKEEFKRGTIFFMQGEIPIIFIVEDTGIWEEFENVNFTETGIYAINFHAMGYENIDFKIGPKERILEEPKIDLKNNVLTISPIQNAEGYKIYVDETQITTIKGNSIDLSAALEGKENCFVSVRATSDEYFDSGVNSIWLSETKKQPGLYDENDKLLASWAELVLEYGMNIEEDYQNLPSEGGHPTNVPYSPYNVLRKQELSSGTKLICGFGKRIGDGAFWCCEQITHFEISDTIVEINDDDLSLDADILQKLVVDPDNPVYADSGNCLIKKDAKAIVYGIPTSVIPTDDSVTSIAGFAFCFEGPASFVIPGNITTIERCAFYNCRGLTSVEIQEGTTTIGNNVFDGCTNLKSIKLPNTITSIGTNVFKNDENLETIEVASGNQVYHSINNCLIETKNNKIIYAAKTLTSVTIPQYITYIDNDAFKGSVNLTSVIFEEGSQLTNIGSNAFDGCKALTNISLPATLEFIGTGAFINCTNLTSVVLENSTNWWRTSSWNLNVSNAVSVSETVSSDPAKVASQIKTDTEYKWFRRET